MARPTRKNLMNGQAAWDALVNDNLLLLFDKPFALHRHAGDESDLETTYPAADYENCLVWVEHSTLGWVIYYNTDGVTWRVLGIGQTRDILTLTSGSPHSLDESADVVIVSSSTAYTVNLPDPADFEGKTLTVKSIGTGLVTVNTPSTETVDGAASYVLGQYQAVSLISDGTDWFAI